MSLQRILISNLRNLSAVDIKPASNINIIYGDNGSGKSSLATKLRSQLMSLCAACVLVCSQRATTPLNHTLRSFPLPFYSGFPESSVAMMQFDSYYKGLNGRPAEDVNFDEPQALDTDLLAAHLTN